MSGTLPVENEQMAETYRKSYRKMLELTSMMFKAGIPVASGTDTMPGFGLHREFELHVELHVEAGIPAADVLSDATLGAARIMKKEKELGSIEAG